MIKFIVMFVIGGLISFSQAERDFDTVNYQMFAQNNGKSVAAVSEQIGEREEEKNIAQKAEQKKTKDSVKSPADKYAGISMGKLWLQLKRLQVNAIKLKQEGKYQESIDILLEAGELALYLKRPGVASWQYNNAAKHSIDLFKLNTDHGARIDKINNLPKGKEKAQYMKESKDVICKELEILNQAKAWLETAGKLDQKKTADNRAKIIANNTRFLEEILTFCE